MLARQGNTTRAIEVVDEETKQRAHELRLQADALALEVEKLYMITEALWTLVKRQAGLTDRQLLGLVKDIDLRSGKLDGRRKRETRPDCPECGRKMLSRSSLCLYCGAVVELDPFKKY
ncbi:MAG: hypothetical protein FWF96_04260 [Kiritimatiellaeota bacterium]|nr:hypothetical protein [Kiritimatiellota bacterium]